MDRSRSKRYYYDQDYDHEIPSRNKQSRFNNHGNNHHYPSSRHHRFTSGGGGGGGGGMVTTSYSLLCNDIKAGSVIGRSGGIIKSIRQRTGALINVHELIPGDEERIIEISDTRRRDPEGRMPAFSPAQEALFMIHERMMEGEVDGGRYNGGFGGEDDDGYGVRGGVNRVVTRLVVSMMHVGCLLGKGGKIIEQMRMETKAHIRVLPRDNTLPRCVSMSEEIVQVVGEVNSVKNALAVISSRLRESQHRDRSGHFHGYPQSSDRFFPPEVDSNFHMNNMPHRRSIDSPTYGSRWPSSRSNMHTSRLSGYPNNSGAVSMTDISQSVSEDIVFRILCPINKLNCVVGETDGIIELLKNDMGVDVKVADPVRGSDEQMIIVSSEEGPDDELFPAQEALLHIQTRIVDLVPEKENIITTRLVMSASDIGCLGGKDGLLNDTKGIAGVSIQILSREELPSCVSSNDELIQIVGDIIAARQALVEVTSRLRSYLYQDFIQKDMPGPHISAPSPVGSGLSLEGGTGNNNLIPPEAYTGNDTPTGTSQNVQTTATGLSAKDSGVSVSEPVKQSESQPREEMPTGMDRSILEVVIPQYAVPKLITKSKNKLGQISELSGASVKLVEDGPDAAEKVIQIAGTLEQAHRAQGLVQGFILSVQEDEP